MFPLRIPIVLCLCTLTAMASSDQTGRGESPSPSPLPAGYDITATCELLSFSETDISDTYHHIAMYGVEAIVPIAPSVSVIISGAYGKAGGSPFFDDPTFDAENINSVTMAPFSLGFRTNVSQNDRLRIYLTGAVQATWVQEEYDRVDDGLCYGFILGYGPEWRSSDDRVGVSVLARWRGGSGDLGRGEQRHGFNTTGFSLRLGVGYKFGVKSSTGGDS